MPTIVTKAVKPGGGGNYSTLAAFVAGEQRNLTAQDQIARAEVYAGVDSAACTISGFSCDLTRYVLVEPAPGAHHLGVVDAPQAYRLNAGFSIGVHARVRGIQVSNQNSWVIYIQATEYRVSECIIKCSANEALYQRGFYVYAYQPSYYSREHWTLEHNLIVGAIWLGFDIYGTYNGTACVINNTVLSTHNQAWTPVRYGGGNSIEAYTCNNVFCGEFFAPDIQYELDYEDGPIYGFVTSNVTQGYAQRTALFKDPVAGDYNPKPRGPLHDMGVAADAYGAPATSINGVARPQGATWDIGAFELLTVVVKETGGTSTGTSTATARAVRIGQTGATTAGTAFASARVIRMQPVGGVAAGTSAASITRPVRIQQTGAFAAGTSEAYAHAQRQAEEKLTGAVAAGTSTASIGGVIVIQLKPTGATATGTSTAEIERAIRIQQVGAEAAGTSEATARGMLLKVTGGAAAGTSLAEILGTTIVLGQRIVLRGSGPTARLVVYGGGRAQEIGAEGLVVPGSDGASYRLRVDEEGEPELVRV